MIAIIRTGFINVVTVISFRFFKLRLIIAAREFKKGYKNATRHGKTDL